MKRAIPWSLLTVGSFIVAFQTWPVTQDFIREIKPPRREIWTFIVSIDLHINTFLLETHNGISENYIE